LSCNACDIGKYSNDTAATSKASCRSCPPDETTDSKGAATQDECNCNEGYTRDCVTNQCTQCATGELFFNSKCENCPSSGVCDGSAALVCTPGSYLTTQTVASSTDTRPVCPVCPKGGDCFTGVFVPDNPESVWESAVDLDGITIFRIIACPAGFALTRAEGNPKADSCEMCPLGYYNIEGSQWTESDQQQSGILSPPLGFCHRCPLAGANCPGGSTVEAQDGWYKFREELGAQRRTASESSDMIVFRVYQCPLEACSTNNTCKGGREGLLCGSCPVGKALELDVCTECSGNAWGFPIFIVVSVSSALIVLFLVGWRYVFPDNLVHRVYDAALQRMIAVGHYVASSCLPSKGRNVKLLQDKGVQGGVQGAKIFLANFQVENS